MRVPLRNSDRGVSEEILHEATVGPKQSCEQIVSMCKQFHCGSGCWLPRITRKTLSELLTCQGDVSEPTVSNHTRVG
jgi:hypothetical protein